MARTGTSSTMVTHGGASSSMLGAARLVALGALSLGAVQASVRGRIEKHAQQHQQHHQRHHRHHRALQTTSSIDYIGVVRGKALATADQEDAGQLQNAEGELPPVATSSIVVETDDTDTAEYELYFIAPDTTGATGFTLTFIGQLDGAQWSVAIKDFTLGAQKWVPAGTLTGITAATNAWGTATIDFLTDAPATYLKARTSGQLEMALRVTATEAQTGFLDYVGVAAAGAPPTPTPTPGPTGPPVDGVTAGTVMAIIGTTSITGNDATVQLANAEGGSTSEGTTAVAFESTNTGLAEFEFYFGAPTTVTGGFTITLNAQLGTGAIAGNWKVEMLNFAGSWEEAGFLAGATTGTWTPVILTVPVVAPAVPTDFVSTDADGEYLVRITTATAATSTEVIYLDQVVVASGPLAPTPAPTTGAPSPIAPTGPTAGIPEFVERVLGADITAAQINGAGLVAAEGELDSAKSVECATVGGKAKYEIYLSLPNPMAGDLTISVTAQLVAGASAANWGISLYNFKEGIDDFTNPVPLTGVTSTSFSTVDVVVPTTTPTDFVAGTIMLVQVSAEGLTDDEAITLDAISISAGDTSPTPTPAPTTAAPTTAAPTTAAPTTAAPTTAAPTTAAPTTAAPTTAAPTTVAPTTAAPTTAAPTTAAPTTAAPTTAAPTTAAPTTAAPTTAAPTTAAPTTAAPTTAAPTTAAPTTAAPTTAAPNTAAPTTAAPTTAAPTTAAPTTAAPTTAAPTTEAPTTVAAAPTTASPTTASPTTASPTTVEPTTAAPTTAAPTTAAPTTAAPTTAATTAQSADVQVDLVPCIMAATTIIQNDFPTASAYLMNEFFKGFWTATQIVQVVDVSAGSESTLDLVDSTNENYGKCNVVYVGVIPTTSQKAQLDAYSIKFKARIVYFNAAATFDDDDFKRRLGMQSYYDDALTGAPRVKYIGKGSNSVVPDEMVTDLATLNLFNTPVIVSGAELPAGVTIKAEYTDESGEALVGPAGQTNVAIAEYIGSGDLLGLEELHVFFELAWFDMGSWAWGHYLAEWGTRGIFQGERRFYLGAVVDDLFLSTDEWEYDAVGFEGQLSRLSGDDLAKFQQAENDFNAKYGAQVKTEHAFNGLGIIDKVGSDWRDVAAEDAGIAVLPKGQKPYPDEGITQQLGVNWLSRAFNPADGVNGMADDIAANKFTGDDLLDRVQADLDAFYWQSHTLSHLGRDNLGANDCDIEDGGNAQMAVLFGFFKNDNYNWRSMTSPGITGLFNPHCLQSGANNLMKCYPGDNTYNGVQTEVPLINMENQFHSLTTTVETNGYAGAQIIPRYATNVYYNCVKGECLVHENEYIRRTVCGCSEMDPSKDQGACTVCEDGNTQSFNYVASSDTNAGPLERLFQTEEQTTTRYILSGRRDKYMFHQANVISTTWAAAGEEMAVNPVPTGNPSLLQYWYERVLSQMSKFINTSAFPIKTLKFDNLCANFYAHEDLDGSGAVLTATKDATGAIIDMTLAYGSANGAPIPLTVPTADAASILTGALKKESTETYGADTTYIFAAGTLKPTDLDKPDSSDLAPIPKAVATASLQQEAQADADAAIASENPAQVPIAAAAEEEIKNTAMEDGFVIEGFGNTADDAT